MFRVLGLRGQVWEGVRDKRKRLAIVKTHFLPRTALQQVVTKCHH